MRHGINDFGGKQVLHRANSTSFPGLYCSMKPRLASLSGTFSRSCANISHPARQYRGLYCNASRAIGSLRCLSTRVGFPLINPSLNGAKARLGNKIACHARRKLYTYSELSEQHRRHNVSHPAVGYWLIFSAASVFGIVVFGGLTRLTESGSAGTSIPT